MTCSAREGLSSLHLTDFATIGFEYQHCPGYKSKKEIDVDITDATVLRIGLS